MQLEKGRPLSLQIIMILFFDNITKHSYFLVNFNVICEASICNFLNFYENTEYGLHEIDSRTRKVS